jgi:hypothetical protein
MGKGKGERGKGKREKGKGKKERRYICKGFGAPATTREHLYSTI